VLKRTVPLQGGTLACQGWVPNKFEDTFRG
jgi:hypothetical protein